MTQQSEPLVLTVEHLKSVGVHRRAIENFRRVFPEGMPCTADGMARAECMDGSYLAALDKFRNVKRVGFDELRKLKQEEAMVVQALKSQLKDRRRAVLAAALAEAVRKLPKTNPLLDVEP